MNYNVEQVIEIARIYHQIEEQFAIFETATLEQGPNGIDTSNDAYINLKKNLIPKFMKFPEEIRNLLIAPSFLENFLK